MESITVGQIVGIIGTLMVLSSFFFGIYKFIKQVVLDKIENNTKRIEILEKEIKYLKRDVIDSKQERLILLKRAISLLKRAQRTRM